MYTVRGNDNRKQAKGLHVNTESPRNLESYSLNEVQPQYNGPWPYKVSQRNRLIKRRRQIGLIWLRGIQWSLNLQTWGNRSGMHLSENFKRKKIEVTLPRESTMDPLVGPRKKVIWKTQLISKWASQKSNGRLKYWNIFWSFIYLRVKYPVNFWIQFVYTYMS